MQEHVTLPDREIDRRYADPGREPLISTTTARVDGVSLADAADRISRT
jgi:hypothetical protein